MASINLLIRDLFADDRTVRRGSHVQHRFRNGRGDTDGGPQVGKTGQPKEDLLYASLYGTIGVIIGAKVLIS